MRTRVKICGITRPEDGQAAARHGADAIGLVFYPQSPRVVTLEQARAIVASLPPFVSTVALFVDADMEVMRRVVDAVAVDLIQFHGKEPPEVCEAVGKPYIKAVPMREETDLHRIAERYAGARGLLLDTYQPGLAGGSGAVFDWSRIPADVGRPVILAGGLDPDNVAEAVRRVRPYGVDVSSGVEQAKGIKDESRIEAFIRGVSRGEHS